MITRPDKPFSSSCCSSSPLLPYLALYFPKKREALITIWGLWPYGSVALWLCGSGQSYAWPPNEWMGQTWSVVQHRGRPARHGPDGSPGEDKGQSMGAVSGRAVTLPGKSPFTSGYFRWFPWRYLNYAFNATLLVNHVACQTKEEEKIEQIEGPPPSIPSRNCAKLTKLPGSFAFSWKCALWQ